MNERPLSGRTALVTGASRGIGAATARALAGEGAHVILTARTSGGLEEVEQTIFEGGGTATIAPVDLIEPDAVARLGIAISGRWDRLDLLVLNAATLGSLGAVTAIDPKELARVLTLNVSAQAALLAAFDPLLRRSAAGRVIALTSPVARSPRAYWGEYGASKAAFEVLVRSYGAEVANISKIRVALVDPGPTRTSMRARAYPGEDPASVKLPAEVAERIAALFAADFETGHFEIIGQPGASPA